MKLFNSIHREHQSSTLGGVAVERCGAHQQVASSTASPDFVSKSIGSIQEDLTLNNTFVRSYSEASELPHGVNGGTLISTDSWASSHGIGLAPSPFNPLASTLCRDLLLSYAQRDYHSLAKPGPSRFAPVPIYQSNTTHQISRIENLRALLSMLTTYHPLHIPTLLLLGSMHYTSGDLKSSLEVNKEILRLEPGYVEAMCNIGCIMQALNEPEAAHAWWWKALQLQPMYWDVMENLLGLISCSFSDSHGQNIKHGEALAVCDFIRSSLLDENGYPRSHLQIPQEQLHRLQSVTYMRACILQIAGNQDHHAPGNYSDVVNLALLTPQIPLTEQITLRDMIISTCITGLISMNMVPPRIMEILGPEVSARECNPGANILLVVHRAGEELIAALHDIGFDALPVIFLDPDQVNQLPLLLFRCFNNVLPSNCSANAPDGAVLLPEAICAATNQITSQALLMIAKYFQDALGGASIIDGTFQSCHISASLVLILYYLALALSPSAIAYNNLGALISTILPTNVSQDRWRKPLYSRAIEIDPHLDSALVNLASALRDAELKATPDAACGLASTLSAICDWRGRGWLETELTLVQMPYLIASTESDGPGRTESGWIHDLVAACEAQLKGAYAQNFGLMRKVYSLQDWLGKIQYIYSDRSFSREQKQRWENRIGVFFAGFDRAQEGINEGGFVIRLVEWLMRGLQHKWYLAEHGSVLRCERLITRRILESYDIYERPQIPSVGHFPVPSLQPFHTVSIIILE
ncbi:hypothetical protein H0H87_009749 [Tephrocybe sp. NHM501043]|nr:hypothetical protein H0H87_009749 [Tephrocybe sp. NHM501043]